ncbi:ABC transporter permease [Allokutzneria sp. A3M-2-11 16]|uniref:ABC transporter permease n=1 Tax=Allokutzneria sp. A3M-2-11 16 TaxID=2962043 RepID=UPI0020B64309|nr:ABC transporter permease [Allokutzneria sp. A3M-2-11 16]MCP3800952.1 ABC transporter permease [Allokutzneria sp. A3M-2-11 16]
MTVTVNPVAARSTGRVVGSVRASLLVVEGLWMWYRRNWRATVFSSVVTPILFLLSLGLGLGTQIRAGAVPGGSTYIAFLAPALLVSAAVQNAAMDSTYPILSAFKWQKTFWGIVSTPVTPGQILGGRFLWLAARLLFSGVAFMVVAAFFGGVQGPSVIVSLLVSVLAGLAFAAPIVAFAATIENEGQQFNLLFRFVVMPMTLFAGTFFPVSQLPVFVQPLAWITPLWHGTELSRGAAFGTLEVLPALGHLAYLLVWVVVGLVLARKYFRVRLTV